MIGRGRLSKLKLARLEMGLSQWDVDKITGISQSTISLYERLIRPPKEEHKVLLAKLYGKPFLELFDEDD